MRVTALLLLGGAIGLSACGGGDEPRPAPAAPAAAVAAPPGAFRLLVPARAPPDRPPPVRVAGGAEGVRIVVERVLDPVAARTDPSGSPREIAAEAVIRDRRLDLPVLPGGEYRVTADRDGREETAPLVLADLSVVVRGGGDEVLVFAVDAVTGTPAAGAEVAVGTAAGRAAGLTDARGVFRTRAPLDGAVCAVVRRGGSFGLAERAALPAARDRRTSWIAFCAPAHAPGDTVAFAGFCRPATPAGGGTFAAEDAGGARAGEGRLEAPAPGLFAGSFRAPPWAARGEGRLRLRFPPDRYAEFPLPLSSGGDAGLSLRIGLPGPESGLPRVVVGHESLAWLAGGLLVWRIEQEDVRRPEGRRILASGERRLQGPLVLDLPAVDPPYTIVAEASDAGGNRARAEAAAAATTAAFAVKVASGLNFCAPGERPVVVVRPAFTGGPPAEVAGTVDTGADRREFRLAPDGGAFAAPLRLPTTPGPCRIRVTAQAADGRTASAETEVFVLPASDLETIPTEARLIPEKSEYAPGEPARVLLLLPPAAAGASALLAAEGDVLAPHVVEEAAPVMLVTLSLPEALGRRVALSAAAARDGREYGAWAEVRVSPRPGGLAVRLSADTGADGAARVRAEVRGTAGESVEAAVLLLASASSEPPEPPFCAAPDGSLEVAPPRGPPPVLLGPWTTRAEWDLPPPEEPGRVDLLAVAVAPDFRFGTGAAVLLRPPGPAGPPAPAPTTSGGDDLVPAADLVLAPGRSAFAVPAGARPPTGAALSLRFRLDPAADPLAAVRDALAGLPPPRTLPEAAALLAASVAAGDPRRDLAEALPLWRRADGGYGDGQTTAAVLLALAAAREAGVPVDPAAFGRPALVSPADAFGGSGPLAAAALAIADLAGRDPPPRESLRSLLSVLVPDPFGPPGRNLLERALAVPALTAAATALGPPPAGTFTVRVRTSAGVAGSVRLVPGSARTASATIDLPASRFTPGPEAIVLECAGNARALLRVLATPGLLPPPAGAAQVVLRDDPLFAPGEDTARGRRPGDLVLVTLTARWSDPGPARLSCRLPPGLTLLPAEAFPAIVRPSEPPDLRPEQDGDMVSFDAPPLPEGSRPLPRLLVVRLLLRAAAPGEWPVGPAVLRPGYGGEVVGAAPAIPLRVE